MLHSLILPQWMGWTRSSTPHGLSNAALRGAYLQRVGAAPTLSANKSPTFQLPTCFSIQRAVTVAVATDRSRAAIIKSATDEHRAATNPVSWLLVTWYIQRRRWHRVASTVLVERRTAPEQSNHRPQSGNQLPKTIFRPAHFWRLGGLWFLESVYQQPANTYFGETGE